MLGIKLQNVSFSYGVRRVLYDLDLDIEPSGVVFVLGSAGSGKTTLLKIIAGLLNPDTGSVQYFDDHAHSMVGMVFQKNALFDSMTVYENIAFPLREMRKISPDQIDSTVRYNLERTGLLPAISQYPEELSGGMKKRLGIARALALQPDLLLLDDPTAGLDPVTGLRIMRFIADFYKRNQPTMVLVSNEPRYIQWFGKASVFFIGENDRRPADDRTVLDGYAKSARE